MRFPLAFIRAGLIGVGLLVFADPLHLHGADTSDRPKTFIYVLRLTTKFHDEHAWTKEDHAVAQRHFERLKAAAEHGPVILAGRTEESADKTFGIVIFEAPDEKAALVFMENDPAVKSGLMTGELHPYMIAVQRPPQRLQ